MYVSRCTLPHQGNFHPHNLLVNHPCLLQSFTLEALLEMPPDKMALFALIVIVALTYIPGNILLLSSYLSYWLLSLIFT